MQFLGHTNLVSGWLNDTQNPSMMEAKCQKIIIICLIYQGIFASFGNIFCRLFPLVFTKNIHANSVGKTFLGCSYHLNGIKEIYIISVMSDSRHTKCSNVTGAR